MAALVIFPVAMTKHPSKSNLRGGGALALAYSSRVQSIVTEQSQKWEPEAAGHFDSQAAAEKVHLDFFSLDSQGP